MVVLARIDQRLIHGIIVNQWAPALQVKRFMGCRRHSLQQ